MTHRTMLACKWALEAEYHGHQAWQFVADAAAAGPLSWYGPEELTDYADEHAASYGVYFAGLVGELVRAGCYEDAAPAVALQMVFEAHQVAGRVMP